MPARGPGGIAGAVNQSTEPAHVDEQYLTVSVAQLADFRRHDADIFGTSEWILLADNGHETPISIADLRSEGSDSWCTGTTTRTALRTRLPRPSASPWILLVRVLKSRQRAYSDDSAADAQQRGLAGDVIDPDLPWRLAGDH
jgi:hypothetical protein